jgi:2-oxoglutarate ferredoxin oxidoreductase subunit delta
VSEKKTGDKGKKKPRGKVHVLEDWCKGCSFCVEFCPKHMLELSDKFNTKGYHPPRVTDPDLCTACDICKLMCPEFAIFIEKLDNKNKK